MVLRGGAVSYERGTPVLARGRECAGMLQAGDEKTAGVRVLESRKLRERVWSLFFFSSGPSSQVATVGIVLGSHEHVSRRLGVGRTYGLTSQGADFPQDHSTVIGPLQESTGVCLLMSEVPV